MKKITFSIAFVLSTLAFAGMAVACDVSNKDDVYFNVGSEFFATRLNAEKPEAKVVIYNTAATVKVTKFANPDEVVLSFKSGRMSGRLFPVYRCQDSPRYIIWDKEKDNPESFGAADDFRHFYSNPSKVTKTTVRNLTIAIDSKAESYMADHGIRIRESNGAQKMFFGSAVVNLERDEKTENSFVLITVQPIPDKGNRMLCLAVTEKDGNVKKYYLDLNLEDVVEIN